MAESEQTSASSNEDMFGDDPNGLDEVTSTSDNDTDHHNMKPKAPGSGHGRHGSHPSDRLPSQGHGHGHRAAKPKPHMAVPKTHSGGRAWRRDPLQRLQVDVEETSASEETC